MFSARYAVCTYICIASREYIYVYVPLRLRSGRLCCCDFCARLFLGLTIHTGFTRTWWLMIGSNTERQQFDSLMPRNNSSTGFHVFRLLTCATSQNSRYQRNTSNRDLQPSHCLCRLPTRRNSTAPPTSEWWSFWNKVSHTYEGSLKWLHHLQHLIGWPDLDTLSRPSWSSLPYLPRDHLRCT